MLNAIKVKSLKTPGRYGDGGGLWLQVGESGSKSWYYRYKRHGRERSMGLGGADDVTLAQARDAARSCRDQLRQGVDPLDKRRAERAARPVPTFREAANLYIDAHATEWRHPKHEQAWRNTLSNYVHPEIGDITVSDVDTAAVMRVLASTRKPRLGRPRTNESRKKLLLADKKLWQRTPVTAARLRLRIEAILDYASVSQWRSGENPARWNGHLEKLLPNLSKVRERVNFTAMPWQEVAEFMVELRTVDHIGARALEFVILTASRTSEVLGATWGEIDIPAAVWTIPARRMKNFKEHRVPLSKQALEILRTVAGLHQPGDGLVFPGEKRGKQRHNATLLRLIAQLGRTGTTTHGFRSTFRQWVAETTAYPGEIAEMCLAHADPNKIQATYQRSDLIDRRRQLLSAWAAFCDQTYLPVPAEVVALRRA